MVDKKVLFLCAHNQTRSVTAEGLLKNEKGYQVKSRALWKGMPRKVTKEDAKWADEVYLMMPGMRPVAVEAGIPNHKIKSLWIPDKYEPCEKALLLELKEQLSKHGINVQKSLNQAEKDCDEVMTRKNAGIFMPDELSLDEGGYMPLWHLGESERKRADERSVDAELELARRLFRGLERRRR